MAATAALPLAPQAGQPCRVSPCPWQALQVAVEAVGDVELVGRVDDLGPQVRADGCHDQRRGDPLARDVPDEERETAVRQVEVVEEVSPDFACRHRHTGDLRHIGLSQALALMNGQSQLDITKGILQAGFTIQHSIFINLHIYNILYNTK